MKKILILLSLFYFALNESLSCDFPHVSEDEKSCFNEEIAKANYQCCFFKLNTDKGEKNLCIGIDKSWTKEMIIENSQQFIDENKESFNITNATLQEYTCKKEEKNGSSYLKTGFLLLSLLFI